MNIGIGLPATIRGVDGATVRNWAVRAEQYGFSTLAVLDRLIHPSYDPLIALAGAAAVTEQIRLATAVIVSPLHSNAVLFAKQLATLDHLSDGRLTLGLGVGWRRDDFEISGVDYDNRGRAFDDQLQAMKRIWNRDALGFEGRIGPAPVSPDGPEVLFGGHSAALIRRIVQHGNGWIGTGDSASFKDVRSRLDPAWSSSGRSGSPRYVELSYFALGPGSGETAEEYLGDIYDIARPVAERFAARAAISEAIVQDQIRTFEALGADELVFIPCSRDLEQVDLLATAALR